MVQGALLWVLNLGVILGVFYWSGLESNQNIYHKHHLRLDTVDIPVLDLDQASLFYGEVLGFPGNPNSGAAEFILPDGRLLRLIMGAPHQNIHLTVRVRSGFEKLHGILEKNLTQHPKGSIEPIKDLRFDTVDPSGNRFTFLRWKK